MPESTPLPHGPFEKLEDNLAVVSGQLPRFVIGRRMTVAKLADGRLVIHSAIALDEPTRAELEAWGTPAYLIVPNAFHRIDAPAYARRYPAIKVLCPPGSTAKVQEVVDVHGDYAALPSDENLRAEVLEGCKEREGVLIVRSGERASLVFNDAVFNLPKKLPGFGGFMTKLMGSTGGPKVTRIGKMFLVDDKRAFADHLRRLAETPGLCRIVVSHGAVIDDNPADVLRRVAGGLHRG